MDYFGLKDSSRDFTSNYEISYFFTLIKKKLFFTYI
jgi:hypothetical protein